MVYDLDIFDLYAISLNKEISLFGDIIAQLDKKALGGLREIKEEAERKPPVGEMLQRTLDLMHSELIYIGNYCAPVSAVLSTRDGLVISHDSDTNKSTSTLLAAYRANDYSTDDRQAQTRGEAAKYLMCYMDEARNRYALVQPIGAEFLLITELSDKLNPYDVLDVTNSYGERILGCFTK